MQKQLLLRIARDFLKKNHELLRARNLPPLFFFSDRKQFKDIFAAVKLMPDFIGIIIREYDLDYNSRFEFAKRIKEVAGKKIILVGKSFDLALAIGADGLHFSDHDLNHDFYNYQKKTGKNFLFTFSAHNPCSLVKAKKNNFDAIFYSPIFPTVSHPKSPIIGIRNLHKIVQNSKIPVYALGGINQSNYKLLSKTKISGVAGISIFKNLDFF